ncbi:YDG/SRA domain-containing protein [Methylobacterium bullatum]|uniref:YDG domain-containing protein n=1 Tax=Methylobacterium bullatum TaxID=570505 RepID=A0AAV4ZBC1_9HYPH|nr:YDG/SRA domain-containing protein [Methylobacterium bullatum]MBD8900672.1 HNH endonuclease [Methylobacterium bullatum]GJD40825.1 hypothetical protein OICFNHDK_3301 [Methylobacterium bullatum]
MPTTANETGESTRVNKTLIGSLRGVEVGSLFDSRRALHDAGAHRALQAGIVGRREFGAESIVLSGGYFDDEDHGSSIIYTGAGGRDPKTGRQIADQDFTGHNQALVTSCLNGLLVRVVRGAVHRSPHSPPFGYRYDGLFRVERYWRERGRDGFLICRFQLEAEVGESARADPRPGSELPGEDSTRRTQVTALRVVRDTALGRSIKRLHDYTCQACGIRLLCEGGPYAEAAHVKPLGSPHHGPDRTENILCLCPNHHVLFDNGGFTIEEDLSLRGLTGCLRLARGHSVAAEYLAYHRALWEHSTPGSLN